MNKILMALGKFTLRSSDKQPKSEIKHRVVNYAVNNREQTTGEDFGRRAGILLGRTVQASKEGLTKLLSAGKENYEAVKEQSEREYQIGTYDALVEKILATDLNAPVQKKIVKGDYALQIQSDGTNREYSLAQGNHSASVKINGNFTKEQIEQALARYAELLIADRTDTAQDIRSLHRTTAYSVPTVGSFQHILSYNGKFSSRTQFTQKGLLKKEASISITYEVQ